MFVNHVAYCKHTYPVNASMLMENLCKVSYMKTIGEILKEARESREMSQEEVAKAVRKLTGETFSRAALAQIESGATKNPKPYNLQAACDVLKIDFRNALKGEMALSGSTQHARLNGTRMRCVYAAIACRQISQMDQSSLLSLNLILCLGIM